MTRTANGLDYCQSILHNLHCSRAHHLSTPIHNRHRLLPFLLPLPHHRHQFHRFQLPLLLRPPLGGLDVVEGSAASGIGSNSFSILL